MRGHITIFIAIPAGLTAPRASLGSNVDPGPSVWYLLDTTMVGTVLKHYLIETELGKGRHGCRLPGPGHPVSAASSP